MPDLTSCMIWCATYFIHSSLLLGGVWLWFRRCEPASHAFREAVWKLAAIGGLFTASLQLGLRIESPINTALSTMWTNSFAMPQSAPPTTGELIKPDLSESQEHHLASGDVDLRTESHLIDTEESGAQPQFVELTPDDAPLVADEAGERQSGIAASNPATVPAEQNTRTRNSSAGPRMSPLIRNALTGILAAFCGAIVSLSGWGLLRLIWEQSAFRRRLSTCRPIIGGPAREILDGLLQEASIRRKVSLILDEQDLEPGACGWLNWRIVLPARSIDELSPLELRGLLAHELAHLIRGDQWWLLCGRLLAVCLGWQPLNRIALREWQRASEYLCDAWAIQRNVPRLSLARCLTTVAEWRLVGLTNLAGLGSGNPSNLSQRVERLVDDAPLADPWQRYSRRHLLAALGCLIAVGMVSLAPAASLPSRASTAIALQSDPSGNVVDATTNTVITEDADHALDEHAELLPTQQEEQPAEVLVTVEMIATVRQQISVDMTELAAELDALQQAISQLPQVSRHPLWRVQMQRFRQRLENVQRLRNAMLIPL